MEYANARYYNANVGRFISKDTWGGDKFDPQTLNKYSYARNNPLAYFDPTGMEVEAVAKNLEATSLVGSHSYLVITPLQPEYFQDYLEDEATSFTIGGTSINDKLVGVINAPTDTKDLDADNVQVHTVVGNPYGKNDDPNADTKFIKEIIKTHENAPKTGFNLLSINANGRNCHNYTTSLIKGAGAEIPGEFVPTGVHPGLGETIPGMVQNNSNSSNNAGNIYSTSNSKNNTQTVAGIQKSLKSLWGKFINVFKSK